MRHVNLSTAGTDGYSDNRDAFLALVQAGLWEKDVNLATYGEIDYTSIYQLAKEQMVWSGLYGVMKGE